MNSQIENKLPITVILNAASGATDKEDERRVVSEVFKAGGVEAEINLARSGAEIAEMARRAAQGSSSTVVAGGGDGTINAVASELVGTGKTLGVLPLGTFNYFARNHGIPLDPREAALNVLNGRIAAADIGEVNGRTFLNNASLGLYPTVLREREKVYRRWGRSRVAAYLSVARTLLRPAAFLRLRIAGEGGQQIVMKTPLIFVGSNKYQLEEFQIRGRSCLDDGKLAFYITKPVGRLGLIGLAFRGFFRQLGDSDDFQVSCVADALVETRRRQVRLAIDGEIVRMKTPLQFQIRSGALNVIVPNENDQTVGVS